MGYYPQIGKLEARALVAVRVRAHAGHRVRDHQLISRAWCVLRPLPLPPHALDKLPRRRYLSTDVLDKEV